MQVNKLLGSKTHQTNMFLSLTIAWLRNALLYLKGILSLILHTSNVPNFTHAHLCSHMAVPREPQGQRRVEKGRRGEERRGEEGSRQGAKEKKEEITCHAKARTKDKGQDRREKERGGKGRAERSMFK